MALDVAIGQRLLTGVGSCSDAVAACAAPACATWGFFPLGQLDPEMERFDAQAFAHVERVRVLAERA